jgi:signal transduction histidine kinase
VLAVSALLALIVGGAFAVLLGAIIDLRESAELADRSREVVALKEEVQKLVVDAETGIRGYLLTGDEAFLQPWQNARIALPPMLDQFQRVPGTPGQRAVAREISQDATAYFRDYSEPLVDAARRGESRPRGLPAITEGKTRTDEMRGQFDLFAENQRNLVVARTAESAAEAREAVAIGIVGIAGSVLLITLASGYLTRAIVQPVRQAAMMADRLAGGDLAARVPETGAGEIRTLQRAFNEMGSSLEAGREYLEEVAIDQAALRRVATMVAHGAPPAEIFTAVTEEAGLVLGVGGTTLLRFEANETATVLATWGDIGCTAPVDSRITLDNGDVALGVLRTGQVSRIDLPPESSGADVRSTVGVPITVEGHLWGVLSAASTRAKPLPEDTEARFADFTDLAGTAIANTQARADLAASRARVVAASDLTRRRIERDLHDGTQQRLVSLALDLRAAEARVPADQPRLRARLSQVATGLSNVLDDLREISRGIHPAILSEGGLGPALKGLARRSAVPVETALRVEGRLPEPIEAAAYYAAAEALANVTKHAHASVVRIEAATRDGRLHLSIADDGAGGADPSAGSGLTGLTDRVESLHGTLTVSSPPSQGTTVTIELPLELSPAHRVLVPTGG